MEIKETGIDGLIEIQPKVFHDHRGRFFESWNSGRFAESGLNLNFVQDNFSFSKKGVLRGLHLQKAPHAQGKLVFVISGSIIDVVVDLRKDSTHFGEVRKFELSSEKANMVFVPEGFAHGFVAKENTFLGYKCTNLYHKDSESGIRWDDPELQIDWGIDEPIISEKDLELPFFSDFKG